MCIDTYNILYLSEKGLRAYNYLRIKMNLIYKSVETDKMDQHTGYKLAIELLAKEFCETSNFSLLNFDIMWTILNNLTFDEITDIMINTNIPRKWEIYNAYLDTIDISNLIETEDEMDEFFDDDYNRWMEYQYGEDLPVEWEDLPDDTIYLDR